MQISFGTGQVKSVLSVNLTMEHFKESAFFVISSNNNGGMQDWIFKVDNASASLILSFSISGVGVAIFINLKVILGYFGV